MPLRDHFRPPVSKKSSWEGFHAMWPASIVRNLRKLLPAGYVAEPRVHLGTQISAASALWATKGTRARLEAWSHTLVVGESMPTLPLWLAPERVVPLDLEPSYEQACHDLWID